MSWDNIKEFIKIKAPDTPLVKRYNLAPTQFAPVIIVNNEQEYRGELFKWGLLPSWAKEPKIAASLTNARSETIAEKPSFRSAFKSRRCIVPVSGFYEWKPLENKNKQPYYIYAKNEEPLFFAGLWETWTKETQEPVKTFTIITTAANDFMLPIHHRMPLILRQQDFDAWLSSKTDIKTLQKLIQPYSEDSLTSHAVATIVNNPRNDLPECIKPAHNY